MLDRQVISEFLEEELKDLKSDIPKDISFDDLVETFCRYVEDDFYEWIRDNYKSFFRMFFDEDAQWEWIRDRIKDEKNQRSQKK